MTTKRLSLAIVLLLACAQPAMAERIEIAAIVNDSIITTADVAERRDLLMALNNLSPTAENQQRITPRVVQSLIDEALQMQEAKRLSISIKPDEITGAIAELEAGRRMPAGSMKDMLKKQGLSLRSLDAQVVAQLSWNKVVQRKLRREVSIAEDEVTRAQAAEAADPGVPEVEISAISIIVATPADEERQRQLAQDISAELSKGTPLPTVATQLLGRPDVRVSPPGWVAEEKLQPVMQQALRTLQPGQTTAPLKSMNTYQLVQLIERRTAPRVPETTEVAVKEIAFPLPPKPTKESLLALRDRAKAAYDNPGDCMSEVIGAPASEAKVRFLRTMVGQLPPELRSIITHLGVTEVSQPLMDEQSLRMFMLCERIDPGMGNLPPAAEVRRKLFNEKIELEAQKHMRNLKRDAFIEIKGPKRDE